MAVSEKSIKFLGDSLDRGRSIPGQSLTNSPDQPYNWEQPAEFSNPKETMLYIFQTIMEPETASNIVLSLQNKVGVVDIASVILYSGFLEGKWNPDLMVLLMEPTMYMVMALAEKAEIDYNLEAGDDEVIELSDEDNIKKTESLINLQEAKLKASRRVGPQSVPKEVKEVIEKTELQPSLLEKIETKKNESLLGKGE